MKLRVISGIYKGRKLSSLPGLETRPTMGKVKEAVFSSLHSEVPGTVWLDVFAGSGSIGIEALSRGAEFVWFVDKNPSAIEIIKVNLQRLEVNPKNVRLLCTDAENACRIIGKEGGQSIDIVYIDPPYSNRNTYVKVITALPQLMVPGGLAVIEHEKGFMPDGDGLVCLRSKVYGLSGVSIYQYGKGD